VRRRAGRARCPGWACSCWGAELDLFDLLELADLLESDQILVASFYRERLQVLGQTTTGLQPATS
jgi:hypothetical protein